MKIWKDKCKKNNKIKKINKKNSNIGENGKKRNQRKDKEINHE